jgi:hypothetical protein
MTNNKNLQILLTFMYPHEAHMAQSYLESYGIDSELRDELTAQVNNFYSNAIGGVKLLVKEEDFSRGIEVLKEGGYINESGTKEKVVERVFIENGFNINACPFCSSENISIKKVPTIWTVIVLFILNAAFPILRKSYTCYDCGREWKFQRRKS